MRGLGCDFAWQRAMKGLLAERRQGWGAARRPVLTCLLCAAPGCDPSPPSFEAQPPAAHAASMASAVNRFMVLHVENDASQVHLTHSRDAAARVAPRVAG